MADIIDEAVDAVDNKIDGVVGVRPLGAVKKVVDEIMPANAIEKVTGIPKPHAMLEDIQDKIVLDAERIIK